MKLVFLFNTLQKTNLNESFFITILLFCFLKGIKIIDKMINYFILPKDWIYIYDIVLFLKGHNNFINL